MMKLSEALRHTTNGLQRPEQNENSQSIQVLGLMPEGGQRIMQLTAEDQIPHGLQPQPLPSERPQHSQLSKQNKALCLRDDPAGRQGLSDALSQCFDALALWGKQPESLPNTIKTFYMVLEDCPTDKIIQAFKFYLRHNEDFPTPAAIYKIIQRGNKPDFDKQLYGAILKKSGSDRTPDEWQYKRDYERFQMGDNL